MAGPAAHLRREFTAQSDPEDQQSLHRAQDAPALDLLASIIVAAKGLLRFPELQSYRAEVGSRETTGLSGQRIDLLTEYFLIGSLASWMLAIAALLLP